MTRKSRTSSLPLEGLLTACVCTAWDTQLLPESLLLLYISLDMNESFFIFIYTVYFS